MQTKMIGARGGVQSICLSEKLASVGRGLACVFVLEIDVHIDALGQPGVEAFLPGRDLLRSVVFEAQAGVGKARSEHFRRRLFVGFGKAKRRLLLATDGIRFLRIPRWGTHLEGESESFRAKGKEVFEGRPVEF